MSLFSLRRDADRKLITPSTDSRSTEQPERMRCTGVRRRSNVYQPKQGRGTRRRLLAEGLEARRLLTAYIVDTASDEIVVDGMISLREAIEAANTNAVVGDAGAGEMASVATDTISFAAGLSSMTISLGTQLSIVDSLDISLGDATDVTLAGGGTERLFSIDADSQDVSISGLTMTGGTATVGGAIFVANSQSLILNDVSLSGNTATGDAASEGGGALFSDGGTVTIMNSIIMNNVADGDSGSGGAVFNAAGELAITATTIQGNVANRAGGGIEASGASTTTLTDVTLTGNSAGLAPAVAAPGNGGGFHISGDGNASIIGGSVIANRAAREGGGLWNDTGTMTIESTTLSENTASGPAADDGGGGIFNNGGTLNITDATIEQNVADGTAGSGGGVLNLGGIARVSDTLIVENRANRAGGGIEATGGSTTTLTNVNLDDNLAGVAPATAAPGNGGGLHVTGNGNVEITGGTVIGNLADNEGGGLWNGSGTMDISSGTELSDNTAGNGTEDSGGGALFNNGGTLIVSGATISNNIAIGTRGSGGGILNVSDGSVTLMATTLSGNAADGDQMGDGGGGLLSTSGMVSISDSSISGNAASGISGSGGGILARSGSLGIANTIIVGNIANRAGGGIEVGRTTLTLTDVTLGGADAADGNSVSGSLANPGNGGGLHVTFDSEVTITGGTVQNNTAVEGGGLWNSATGRMTIDGTMIANNSAVRGGGIHNDAGDPTADQIFSLAFVPLNGSSVSGTGSVTVGSPTASTRTVRVVIDASGLEDLSGINGAVHVAHIHGQFAGNAARPVLSQGDGPFFDGAGGAANGFPPVSSILPSVAEDDGRTIDDGFLDFLEGRPKYGPVVLNLTSTQLRDAAPGASTPPDGVPPLSHFLNLAGAGTIDAGGLFPSGTMFSLDTTYTFDLNDPDDARQFNNITPAGLREIVLHGATIDKAISDAIDAAAMGTAPAGVDLGDGTAFRVTAPVAAAELMAVGGRIDISGAAISGNSSAESGGGILNESGEVSISETAISGNSSGGDEPGEGGGGIFSGGQLTIVGGSITQNLATDGLGNGGGILNAGTLRVTGTSITENEAARAGGGVENEGTVELTDVVLNANVTGINGGGLHVSGSGVAIITGGTVNDNAAGREGGGLWNSSSIMTVNDTTLSGNTASGDAVDAGGGAIFNNRGDLTVTDSIITGNSADGTGGSGGGLFNLGGTMQINSTEITGNSANRAGGGIEATSGSATSLASVTLSTNVAGPDGSAAPGNGGGLHVTGAGAVDITDSMIEGNSAASEGGGLWNGSGLMTIVGGTIDANTASGDGSDQGGGGVFNSSGTVRISNGTVIENNVVDGLAGSGGGILNDRGATLIVSDAIVRSNIANRAGGGIETGSGSAVVLNEVRLEANLAGIAPATPSPGNGGGLHVSGNGNVTIVGGQVLNNRAAAEGGGLWNGSGRMTVDGVLINGNRASGNDADQGGGGLFNEAGRLVVRSSNVSNNFAVGSSGSGGGILNNVGGTLIVEQSSIANNSSSRAGGGIEDNAGASVMISQSDLIGNQTGSAPGNGGGLHITGAGNVTIVETTIANNQAVNEGGGLWNSAVGTLSIARSTISGNSSGDGGGVFGDGSGGNVSVANSTLSANVASSNGGGIAIEGGALTLTSVTITANTADVGGGINIDAGSVSIANSIVASNTANTAGSEGTGSDVLGTVASSGNNLFGNSSGLTVTGSVDLLDIDPLLGPLADNGGPTLTHALLVGSPALDAGGTFGLSVDQRGVMRPQGPAIDIGAFESSIAGLGDDGDIDADDGAAGSMDDGNDDEFDVAFDAGSGQYVVRINGTVVQRITPGSVSVIRISGSGDNDTISFSDTMPADSNFASQQFMLSGFGGNDSITVTALAMNNTLDIDGGAGSDTVTLGDASADSLIFGLITVAGGTQIDTPRRIRSGGVVMPSDPVGPSSRFVESMPLAAVAGDTLNVNFRQTGAGEQVLIDLVDGSMLRSFVEAVDFSGFETIEMVLGDADDFIEIRSSTASNVIVTVDGRGGDDILSLIGTGGNDTLIVQSIMTDSTPRSRVEVGDVEFLFVDALGGSDVVINDTGGGADTSSSIVSILSGGPGEDVLLGGNSIDVLFGGSGVDTLIAGGGDDYLFSDRDPLGVSADAASAAGELLQTGSGNDRGAGLGGDVLVGETAFEGTEDNESFLIFPQSEFSTATLADIDGLVQEAFDTLAALGFIFPIEDGSETDLGEVDFRLIESLSLRNRPGLTFTLMASQTGTLTVEAISDADADGAVRMVLLDDQDRFLAIATPQSAGERLDFNVDADQIVKIVIAGDNSDFDLRINNLVSGGPSFFVNGTSQSDSFTLSTNGPMAKFSVNGTTYERRIAGGEQISFMQSGGDDELRLSAADGMARVLKQGNFVAVLGDQIAASIRGIPIVEVLVGDLRPLLQNTINRFDVTGDGDVTTLDALRIINYLGRVGDGPLSSVLAGLDQSILDFVNETSNVDVSGDNRVTTLDVLQVINQLARVTNNSAQMAGSEQTSASETSFGAAVDRIFVNNDDDDERFDGNVGLF